MESKTTAKDFFLHLGSMVALYATAISLVDLLFKIIDKAYPEVTSYYVSSGSVISFQVAMLIIVFPIFILLAWLLEKSYSVDPNKRQVSIKKWLTYITLFVGGVILVGDLVTVLYRFLDGQDLTTAFLLNALVVLIVAGGIFTFYIQDVRDLVSSGSKKLWAMASTVIIVGSIILGFVIIGSPQSQRLMRYDDQKVNDLQNIQWNIVSYWQKKGVLPETLTSVKDPISGISIPVDPQTSAEYKYQITGAQSFKLCATFNAPSVNSNNNIATLKTAPIVSPEGSQSLDYWNHGVGETCFDRNIDAKLYPVYK